ncbi:MAG: hypothetical protein R2769_04345 [Saprospiraceae bacterium]
MQPLICKIRMVTPRFANQSNPDTDPPIIHHSTQPRRTCFQNGRKLYVDGDIPEDQRMFGGIVTYGTPHQGARILNNTEPNGPDMAGKFAIDACEELGIGP